MLVAIDETRRLNKGSPAYGRSDLMCSICTAGDHVIHVGSGQGYYSAILAEIVGPTGRVTAIEIDPDLATKARRNLASDWPQATVVAADGFAYRADAPADAIIVNAGVTHLSLAWLAVAPEKGRLLVPITGVNWTGKDARLSTGHGGAGALAPPGPPNAAGSRIRRSRPIDGAAASIGQ